MPTIDEPGSASTDVPDVDGPIRARRSQKFAIGRPCQSRHFIFTAEIAVGQDQGSCRGLPDLHYAVVAARGEIFAIGRPLTLLLY